jgi:hypothetical protein
VAIVSPDKVEVRPVHLDLKETTITNATMALAELAEKGTSGSAPLNTILA